MYGGMELQNKFRSKSLHHNVCSEGTPVSGVIVKLITAPSQMSPLVYAVTTLYKRSPGKTFALSELVGR